MLGFRQLQPLVASGSPTRKERTSVVVPRSGILANPITGQFRHSGESHFS